MQLSLYFVQTCKLSAAFRKLSKAFCDTCTSPLYMNSSSAAIFSADVASNITHTDPCIAGAVSNKSAKFLEHAANMSLWALKIVPEKIHENETEMQWIKKNSLTLSFCISNPY